MIEKSTSQKIGRGITKLIWNIILFLCLVFSSGYALTSTDRSVSLYFLGFVFVCFLFSFNYKKMLSNSDSNRSLYLWLILVISSLFSTIINLSTTNVNACISMIVVFSVAFFISETMDFQKFAKTYIVVMKYLTLIALLMHILIIVLGINLNLESFTNINGSVYLNGYVFFLRKIGSVLSSRSMSVFWEPGLYASFLIFAFICEIYFTGKKLNKLNIFIFTFGIIISQSTAGYLLIILVYGLLFFRNTKKGFSLNFIVLMLIFLVLYLRLDLILGYLAKLNYSMFYKIYYGELLNSTRNNSLRLNYFIFSQSPFFGNGYSYANTLYKAMMPMWNVSAQTSTSLFFVSALGIGGAIYSIAWIYSIIKLKNLNVYSKTILLVLILIIVNKEPHQTILFTYCLLFFFLKNSSRKMRLGFGSEFQV